jgi:hypothetical protein
MVVVNPEKLVSLQHNADGVRNVSGRDEGENSTAYTDYKKDLYFSPCCK